MAPTVDLFGDTRAMLEPTFPLLVEMCELVGRKRFAFTKGSLPIQFVEDVLQDCVRKDRQDSVRSVHAFQRSDERAFRDVDPSCFFEQHVGRVCERPSATRTRRAATVHELE